MVRPPTLRLQAQIVVFSLRIAYISIDKYNFAPNWIEVRVAMNDEIENENNDPPDEQPPDQDRIWSAANAAILQVDIPKTGLLIFLIAGLFAIVFLFISSLVHMISGLGSDWFFLRSVELFLKISAVGIIVTFIATAKSNALVVFGLFVITALIIPTKDVVRLALLAFNRPQGLAELYPGDSIGNEFQGRDSDLASKIVTDVALKRYENGGNWFMNINHKQRKEVVDVIVSAIRVERVATFAERTRIRGATGPLAALRDEEYEGYFFRFGREDWFTDQMTFLRGLSLVAFEQGRFEAASMTDFGRDVLEVIEPVSTRTVDGPRVGANDAISVQVLSLADIETDTDACQTEVNESQFEQINAVPFSQIHSITRVTSYLPFVLPETGIFKFTLSTGAGDGDPFLVLMDEKCTLIPPSGMPDSRWGFPSGPISDSMW